MANDITSRPWFIDTAAAGAIWKYQVFIKFIEVVDGVTLVAVGTSMATITDQNSKSIIAPLGQTGAVGEVQTYNLENWFNGLIVSALATSVTLRIHIK